MPGDQYAVCVRHAETPGQIRGFAPQFAIDEIAEPAGEKSDARQRRQEIEHIGNPLVLDPRERERREPHPGHTAVKRHAAVPDVENVQPILRDDVMAVKNTPAEPAAEDDADGAIKYEVIDIERSPGRPGPPRAVTREPPCGGESDEVHDPVPVHAQRPEAEYRADRAGDGMDVRGGQHARSFSLSLTRQEQA